MLGSWTYAYIPIFGHYTLFFYCFLELSLRSSSLYSKQFPHWFSFLAQLLSYCPAQIKIEIFKMNDPETLKYFPAYLSFSSFLLSSLFSSLLYTSHLSTLSLSFSGFRKCFQPTKFSRKKIPAWTLLWKWTFMELRNNRIVLLHYCAVKCFPGSLFCNFGNITQK